MIGEVLGGYRVTAKIGEGGMGVVYRAEHTIMNRKAVVKVLRAQLSTNREMVQRFFNEARAAAAISHPGIVSVFDLGQREDGCAYIVMDYLEGESLGTRLRRQGTLPSYEALAITRQILSALSAAHSRGIVHRDLKPDNIFLVPDPEVAGGERIKLLDFGIAKLQDDSGPGVLTTRAGALMGTPLYMSPEQCRGAGQIDHRADLYAVGVMLFELLTGKPPFVARAAGDLMAAHMRDAPPKLRDRVSGLPPGLEEVVATLLAKRPEERFESGSAAIHKIDTLAAGSFTRHDRSPSQPIGLPTDAHAQTLVRGSMPGQAPGTTLSDSARSLPVVREAKSSGSRRAWLMAALGLAVLGTAATIGVLSQSQGVASSGEGGLVATTIAYDARAAEEQHDAALTPPDARVRAATDLPTPLADALPPLDFQPVAVEDNVSAKRHNSRGTRRLLEGKVEEARSDFLEAIQKDPGHLFGRYNYASILATEGAVHEAVEILRQIKAVPDCPQCMGRLQFATEDEAWKLAWEDPAFKAITANIRIAKPRSDVAATLVAAAIASGDFAEANLLFAPREVILTFVSPTDCKRGKCRKLSRLQGLDEIRSLLQDLQIKYGAAVVKGEAGRCDRKCCPFDAVPDAPVQLQEVCTTLDTAGVRFVSRLEFNVFDPSAALED